MKTLCIILATALLSLCSAHAHSTEWVPTPPLPESAETHSSEVAKVDNRFALPVYFGWPARSYEVIGIVNVHADDKEASREEIIRSAVACAKSRGADAFMAHYVNPNIPTDVLFSGFAMKWRKK